MSEGKTGGQAAYEAYAAKFGGRRDSWEELPASYRGAWEAAAAAGAAAAHERTAELVSEVNELRQVLSSPAELARWVEVNHGDHLEWVDELRALLPVDDPPAVVTSGTEHLAKLIGGLAIGGEDDAA